MKTIQSPDGVTLLMENLWLRHKAGMKQRSPSVAYLKQMLISIYQCKKPFELLVIDKKPKTRMGVYVVEKHRIRVYAGWREDRPLEEIAIHEYAHHIHETEKRLTQCRRKERVHGPQFWRIYSALMSVAQRKGLFTDSYIADIIDGSQFSQD